MGISWTDEQKSVINSRHGNLLVSAAAGSGKTAVLVERILEMVMGIDADGRKTEAKIDIDEVLVVTFTRAAAAQMKEKIADKLEQAAEEHPEDEHIVKQLSLLPRADIMTIDSFCLGIVKDYFQMIGIDSSFDIADNAEMDLIKNDILDEVLEQKYQNYIYLIRPKGQIPDISKGLVKNFCYIEVKSDNILNAGEYTMKESGKPFFDVVHIFAAKLNFQPSGSEAGRVFLECGDDIKYIFQNADKLIRPLQEKGIKVCLSMFGSNGVGLANLSKETAISVAKEIKYYVETYGLDGVDFDDEWADYKKHNLQNTYKGFDAPSGDNYARLIYECRRLMPDKLITVYEFGTPPLNGTTRVTGDIVVENQKVVDMIDYTYYGSYGSYATNRENTVKVPREMYGPCPVNLNFIVNDGGQKNENYFTSTSFLETNLGKVVSNGYGAMVFYNLLPSIDYSFGLNEVGKKLYGEEVVWSGKTYDKTSAEPKVVERINYDSYIGTWKIKPLESLYWFAEGDYWQFGGAEEFTIRIEPKEKGHTYNVYGWGDVKELIEDYPFEMQYNSQTGRLEVAGGQELYNENGKTYTLYGRYQSFGSNIATIKKTDTFLKSTLLRSNTNFTIYGLNGTSIIADKKLMIVPLCSDSNEDNNNLKSGDKHPVGPFSFTKVSDLY